MSFCPKTSAVVKKAPDEPFEVFEARAAAIAKDSGNRFVVINVPDSGPDSGSVWAEYVNERDLEKKRLANEMSDAELLVFLSGALPAAPGGQTIFEITDREIDALIALGVAHGSKLEGD
jgi:hypothetical protein